MILEIIFLNIIKQIVFMNAYNVCQLNLANQVNIMPLIIIRAVSIHPMYLQIVIKGMNFGSIIKLYNSDAQSVYYLVSITLQISSAVLNVIMGIFLIFGILNKFIPFLIKLKKLII
jgi:hypothetical protein